MILCPSDPIFELNTPFWNHNAGLGNIGVVGNDGGLGCRSLTLGTGSKQYRKQQCASDRPTLESPYF
jgi:hypothetical protein